MTQDSDSLLKSGANSETALPVAEAAAANAAPPPAARPYRIFGLLVSLPLIGALTILYCVAAVLATYVALFGLSRLAAVWTQMLADSSTHGSAYRGMIQDDLEHYSSAPFVISILLYVAAVLAVLTLARWKGRRSWRDLVAWHPWSLFRAGRAYWITAAATIAYSLVANGLLVYYYPASKDWFPLPKHDPATATVLFFLAAVFAPVAEELFFRGWIFTSLRGQFGFIAALLVSSLAFALAHNEQTHLYALVVFPIGIGLGVMRERSKSIKATIAFHAFFNTLAFALAALDIA